tara:strand:+ start:1924 stop:2658 length:735 start_codon:yes stop_codon:yes gene_type:complete
MSEISFFLIYFCLISSLQSSLGVGILVLGTPFLLILGYNIIEIFFTLLPLSIITSLINMFIMKLFKKKFTKSNNKELRKFFIICIPSIFVGLLILKYFENYINFKILVSIVIISSVIFVMFKKHFKYKINFFRISILTVVGVIHGLTNSGGTLMSLALSANRDKDYARFNITFFYLVLAFFQYLITIIVLYDEFTYPKDINLFWAIIIGVAIGNILNKFIDQNKYKVILNILAIVSSAFLLINI